MGSGLDLKKASKHTHTSRQLYSGDTANIRTRWATATRLLQLSGGSAEHDNTRHPYTLVGRRQTRKETSLLDCMYDVESLSVEVGCRLHKAKENLIHFRPKRGGLLGGIINRTLHAATTCILQCSTLGSTAGGVDSKVRYNVCQEASWRSGLTLSLDYRFYHPSELVETCPNLLPGQLARCMGNHETERFHHMSTSTCIKKHALC